MHIKYITEPVKPPAFTLKHTKQTNIFKPFFFFLHKNSHFILKLQSFATAQGWVWDANTRDIIVSNKPVIS